MEKNIGNITVKINEDGLILNLNLTPDRLRIQMNSEELQEFVNFLNSYRQIQYKDSNHIDKRKILRQLSIADEITVFLDRISNDVYQILINDRKFKGVLSLFDNLIENIKTFLIEGYLFFEIIHDNDKPLALQQLDSNTLTFDGTKWVLSFNNPAFDRILFDNRIIYFIYNLSDNYISYVDEIKNAYEKLAAIENTSQDIKIIRYFKKKLNKKSKIPKNFLHVETYNRFIKKIADVFINEIDNKLYSVIN
jgi:hypothetical protein